ncbi:hypothetical protein [aff. Roholtiella sp. LEGE 12411]|uniref:hypothetical protein n=1 Tax=aff. Roholtiella sp. LEGE 12411 TaxID=1828822 RepID=UPI0018821123|nr:hypothetical protein [aff. Roholtiella sp. LEGE 12411]MBE9037672.1 hypothetical protein [aff. Roholtiella sp. LEGE 12411]
MGHGEEVTNAQCPMPNAQCPMPNAQCPTQDSKNMQFIDQAQIQVEAGKGGDGIAISFIVQP